MASERIQIFSQVVVVVASAAVISGAVAVWRLATSGVVLQVLGGVASGAVVAYDLPGGCPEGWSGFDDGQGRVVVGSGVAYPYRDVGGAEQVVLGPEHLPEHRHAVEPFGWGFGINGNGAPQRLDLDDGPPWNGIAGTLTTSPAGQGEAHQNMPPYIILHLCRRD